MQRKKIALISDAWVPQVNGVVTTFQSIIPILEKKGFQIKILHPEMFSNFRIAGTLVALHADLTRVRGLHVC